MRQWHDCERRDQKKNTGQDSPETEVARITPHRPCERSRSRLVRPRVCRRSAAGGCARSSPLHTSNGKGARVSEFGYHRRAAAPAAASAAAVAAATPVAASREAVPAASAESGGTHGRIDAGAKAGRAPLRGMGKEVNVWRHSVDASLTSTVVGPTKNGSFVGVCLS